MTRKFITDSEFRGIDYSTSPIEETDFENCHFINCNFANTGLNNLQFEDCVFENCDLSNVPIQNTAFRNIQFNACKLIGLQFDTCNPFLLSFQFQQSILNFSSFYRLQIPGTVFQNCTIEEADFTETNLAKAVFDDCILTGTMFGNTSLQNADLYNSSGFIIDPETNNLNGARFSIENLPGLLMKYNLKIER